MGAEPARVPGVPQRCCTGRGLEGARVVLELLEEDLGQRKRPRAALPTLTSPKPQPAKPLGI